MTRLFLSDLLMSIGGTMFTLSVIPQIIRVTKLKSAAHFSWLFLISTTFAVALFTTGKYVIGCWVAASIDLLGFCFWAVLCCSKFYWRSNET